MLELDVKPSDSKGVNPADPGTVQDSRPTDTYASCSIQGARVAYGVTPGHMRCIARRMCIMAVATINMPV